MGLPLLEPTDHISERTFCVEAASMTSIVHKQWSASSMRLHNVVDSARVVAGIIIVARQLLYPLVL